MEGMVRTFVPWLLLGWLMLTGWTVAAAAGNAGQEKALSETDLTTVQRERSQLIRPSPSSSRAPPPETPQNLARFRPGANAADALALAITHVWRGSASNRLEAAAARARTQQSQHAQQQTPVRTR